MFEYVSLYCDDQMVSKRGAVTGRKLLSSVISDRAVGGRILEQNAGQLGIGKVDGFGLACAQRHAERFSPRLHHGNGLGMTVLRGEEFCSFMA